MGHAADNGMAERVGRVADASNRVPLASLVEEIIQKLVSKII
jgi:hypothetical protein